MVVLCLIAMGAKGLWAQAGLQGQWTTLPYLMPINPIHMALLNNGKVLVVSGSQNDPTQKNYSAAIWDPQAGAILTQTVGWDMFCNGMVIFYDGRAFINGGTLQYDPSYGLPRNAVYDPATGLFTDLQDMAHGRWYPTVTTLGDGRVMTFSGLSETGATNTTVEIYTVGSGWSQEYDAGWTPPLYPRMHLMLDGNVFYSGSGTESRIFYTSTRTWSDIIASTNYPNTRTYGSSVLLPLTPANGYRPRVIIMGGGDPATATTEIIDLSASPLQWQYGPSMSQPRIMMNATILPDGKVLAVGGSTNREDATTASLKADLYDPNTNSFSSAGANAYPRLYHSGALLLPDGTVLLVGGNPTPGSYEAHMELYSPAYLFNTDGSSAVRPSITGLSSTIVSYGATFQVQTPNAANIASVVLVRPGAPTHSFDMEQRLVGLSYTAGAGVLTVSSPPNGNVAPPGYYMLFILNSAGVPSLAKFVRLNPSPDFTITATPTTRSVNAGGSTTYTVTISPANGFTNDVTLSVSGLPAGATGTFSPATVTGGSGTSTLTVATSTSTPIGSSTLTITGVGGSVSHATTVTLGVSSGSMNVTLSSPTTTQNLTALGTTDWAHWGLTTASSYDHKSGITPQISNFTVVGSSSPVRYSDHPFGFSWTGGTPTSSATATRTGVYVIGQNNGFRITAPADTSQRTLMVFVDAWNAQGKIVAHLSDNSVADYVDTSLNGTSSVTALGMYTFVYNAASAGQTITITFTQNNTSSGNVALQAAALQGNTTDFGISATPSTQSTTPGANATYTVTVSPQNGFTGDVSLSVSGLPAGATGTFSPAVVTGGSGTSTLTISTLASTPTGTSALTITGSSGTLSHTTGVTLAVSIPDFTITATPTTRSVSPGGSTTYTVTISPVNGFTNDITLSVSGLPAGATGTFSPATVTGGSGTSTLTISTLASTPTGTSPLTITGSSGTLSHTTGVTLAVSIPDFTITATPTTRSVNAGGSTTYTVTISPANGFTNDITLSVSGLPAGATGTFSPAVVTGGSGTSTLTVVTTTSTPIGSSTLTITGVGGSVSHATAVTLGVSSVSSGSMNVTLSSPTTTQNLTALGTTDWAHWGLTTASSYDHKSGVTPQISNFTVVGSSSPARYSDHPFGFSWTGGTPTSSATATRTGVYVIGQNNGFRITAPADTSQRTLMVFVDAWNAQGKIVAHLSDNSVADYVDISLNGTSSVTALGMYTFVYNAASAGQTITVTFTQNNTGSGNVALQAAALK